jgi:hypothetical protein
MSPGATQRGVALMRRTILAIAAATSMVVAFGQLSVAGTIAPVLVKGRSAVDEFNAAADGTYLLWTQNTIAHPRHYDGYIQPLAGGSTTKVNAAGTKAFVGPTINGTEAVFQEIASGARVTHSNVYLYDTTTDTRSNPPAGVNTKDWEWGPASSPGFILFGRNQFKTGRSPWKVILYDRNTQQFTVLDQVKNRCGCIFPGGVTDSYATWTKCSSFPCQAYYYDISGQTTHTVPNPLGKQQYYPSPSGDSSSIYFVRSGTACGANANIMRYDIGGGDPVVVSNLPDNHDVEASPSVYTDGLSSDHVYFGELTCKGNFYGDIYKIDGAEVPTFAGSGSRAKPGRRVPRPVDPRATP